MTRGDIFEGFLFGVEGSQIKRHSVGPQMQRITQKTVLCRPWSSWCSVPSVRCASKVTGPVCFWSHPVYVSVKYSSISLSRRLFPVDAFVPMFAFGLTRSTHLLRTMQGRHIPSPQELDKETLQDVRKDLLVRDPKLQRYCTLAKHVQRVTCHAGNSCSCFVYMKQNQ